MYGWDTHSWRNSTEKRQIDRDRKETTEKMLAQPRKEIIGGPICNCRSFRFAHEIEAHSKLLSDHDWRPWEERKNQYVFDERFA